MSHDRGGGIADVGGTGRRTYIPRVEEFFRREHNTWYTIREVADALSISHGSARSACRTLERKGFLISSQHPAWAQRDVTKGAGTEDRRAVAITFRTASGYMASSRFEKGPWVVEVIWVNDHPIEGPFCKHCGNPLLSHGPDGECLNYRIHPLLPVGDLPKPKRRD